MITLTRKTETYQEDGQLHKVVKVYTAPCPYCHNPKAVITSILHYTNGVPHEGSVVAIHCTQCKHRNVEIVGPDI